MNETLKLLYERKSVRKYTEEKITKAERAAILKAAFAAPSAGNQQLYSIIEITNEQLKEKLSVLCDNQPFMKESALMLVFVADCQKYLNAYYSVGISARKPGAGDILLAVTDTAIAAQNAVIAAESMGIGSCYIGDITENAESVREALKLPRYVMPVVALVFGRPTEQQQKRPKPARFKEEAIVFENCYQTRTDDELGSDFTKRAAENGQTDFNFEEFITAFCRRKYESDFSREMSRSAEVYLKEFM